MKELREKKGLTQQALADALNIGKSAIALYETEKRQPDPDTLRKLAKFFHCSTDYLLGLTNDSIPKDREFPYLPPEIMTFALDKENHDLIRLIINLKAQGYSNQLIAEWIVSLSNTLKLIKQTYLGNKEPWTDDSLLMQEPKGGYAPGRKLNRFLKDDKKQ